MPAYDLAALRAEEFPWTERGDAVYLNHASTGPLPRRTVRAVHELLERRTVPSRFTDAMLWDTLRAAREAAARLIGADVREIALATNTGFGLNLAAFGLPLAPGDVVLAPDREFPANVYPWMAAAERRGIIFQRLPAREDGGVDEARLRARLADPAVRAVTVSWVGFVDGYRVDLAAIGRACRASGAYFVVDAIQGLGALPIDVHALGIDILACGAQKWLLSPWGSGFTYVREAIIDAIDPHVVGWTGVDRSDDFSRLLDYDLTWREDARRYETLTLPVQDIAGMTASLGLLAELGRDAVRAHVEGLAERIVRWAAERPEVRMVTPSNPERRAGIVSLRLSDAGRASARLAEAGVAHSLREGCIRLSPHCYNTDDEVDRALAVLDPA